MKKIFSLVLALCMLLACCASAEAVDLTGEWFADLFGMSMNLVLNADGTYTMDMMGEIEEGTWAQTETGVTIDEEMSMVYDAAANTLTMDMDGMALVFGREAVAAFVAAEARTDATLEEYAGTWNATMISMMGMTVNPADMGMAMGVIIDGTSITMTSDEGEGMVEDEKVEGTFADGVLTVAVPVEGEAPEGTVAPSLVLTLLVDGTLQMETSAEGLTMVVYMEPVAAEEMPVEEVPAA